MNKIYLIIALIFTVGLGLGFSVNVSGEEALIPSWIKTTAGFWVDGQIGDKEFIQALQYLVKEGILEIPSEQNNITTSKLEPTSQSMSKEYPRVLQRLDGEEALKKFHEFTEFLTNNTPERFHELAERSVPESEFVFVINFAGDWEGSYIEGADSRGYSKSVKISGKGLSIIPFDCSHNRDYHSFVFGTKKQETGKITIMSFKNGVLVSYDTDEKPWGNTYNSVYCDYPLIIVEFDKEGNLEYDYTVLMKQYFP